MLKTYLLLIAATFFEVAGTMLLPVTKEFSKPIPTGFLIVFYTCAFFCLSIVVSKLPLAVVYATWCGLGIFTVAILGYLIYGQTLSWQVILGLFLIVIGLTLVNMYSSKVIN
tara:strand:- start:1261 stop:1596 length:336 start_codon:yes stop_codon:yes gene_type:complete